MPLPPSDWSHTELYRNTVNNSGTATLIETRKAMVFHDANVNYGTTYYYWAKVVDLSGNKSGFSPSASITVGTVDTGDITGDAVSGVASVVASDAQTTNSTTAVQIPNMSVTLTTQGGPILLAFTAAQLRLKNNDSVTQTCLLNLEIRRTTDVVTVQSGIYVVQSIPAAGFITLSISLTVINQPAAGTWTYAAYWSVALSTMEGRTADRALQAVELKR